MTQHQPSWYQGAVDGSAAVAGGASNFTILAGAVGFRYRIFGADFIHDPDVASVGIKGQIRDTPTNRIIGRFALNGTNKPSDHLFFGDGGIALSPGEGINIQYDGSAAGPTTLFVTVRFLAESV